MTHRAFGVTESITTTFICASPSCGEASKVCYCFPFSSVSGRLSGVDSAKASPTTFRRPSTDGKAYQ